MSTDSRTPILFPMLSSISEHQRWTGRPCTLIQKGMSAGKVGSVDSSHFCRITIHLPKWSDPIALVDEFQMFEKNDMRAQTLCCFGFVALPIRIPLPFSA